MLVIFPAYPNIALQNALMHVEGSIRVLSSRRMHSLNPVI